MANFLRIDTGRGSLSIDTQPGTLKVKYEILGVNPPPEYVFFRNTGGQPEQGDLPVGDSEYQVAVAFDITYNLGNCPAISFAWWYE